MDQHLDLTRLWGRWLRWSEAAVSYSQGFNPHPRLSFGPPLPVGCESTSEYLDIDLAHEYHAEELRNTLNTSTIDGLEILAVSIFKGKCKTLNAVVSSTEMRIPVSLSSEIQATIANWLMNQHVMVERTKKERVQLVDIRSSVREVTVDTSKNEIKVLLSLGNGPTARLGELIEQWNLQDRLLGGAYRTGMFVHSGETVTSPMEAISLEAVVLSTVESTSGI